MASNSMEFLPVFVYGLRSDSVTPSMFIGDGFFLKFVKRFTKSFVSGDRQ